MRRRVLRRLIWVYSVYSCLFVRSHTVNVYGTHTVDHNVWFVERHQTFLGRPGKLYNLTFTTPCASSADDKLIFFFFFFFFFSRKNRVDISCKLSQFAWNFKTCIEKNKKNYFSMSSAENFTNSAKRKRRPPTETGLRGKTFANVLQFWTQTSSCKAFQNV